MVAINPRTNQTFQAAIDAQSTSMGDTIVIDARSSGETATKFDLTFSGPASLTNVTALTRAGVSLASLAADDFRFG